MDSVVVAFISFILLLSIGFELAHHHLKETTPEAFQPILTSLYSELTLLGFIGLLMFTIFKLEILEELSKHLFGEGEEIKELGEQVHMVLFGVMALFLAQAVALAQFGEFIQRKWHVWECTPLVSKADEEERYKSLKAAAKLAKNPATFWTFALKNRMSEKYRLVLHTAARLRFVEENGLAHSDFDFARYLACRLGHALGELVEVPAQTWILLEVVLLCFWQADVRLGPNMRLFLWLLTGYATSIATYAIHAKLRLILHDYCAPFVEADVAMMHRLGAAAEKDLHGHERFPTSPRTPATKDDSDEEAPTTIAAQGNERTKMLKALKGESTRSLVDVLPTLPMRRRGPEAAPLQPVTETPTENYAESFWFWRHPGPHFTFDMIRLSTLMTAIYIVIFALVYLDDLLVGDDEAFEQRGGLVGGLLILLIGILPPLLVLRKVTRILEDFVVVANISDLKNRRTIEIVLRRQKTVAAFEALKVVQCLRDPKMLLRVVGHQSIASPLSISSDDLSAKFKSPEQPKAKKSIALSESPPEDYQPTPETSSTPFAAKKRALKEHTRSSKRRHRASVAGLTQLRQEEADIYEARQRSQWRRIFDLFDDDGEGSIDRNEMRDLMRKFSPEATIDEIEAVCDALDSDGGGDISFEEFFDFTQKLTFHMASVGDTHELAKDMFKLIDADDSGEITVHEMHAVVSDLLGLDLSVEDVFNVVQDIDEDGNGELDLEEFEVLLERFGIFEDLMHVAK
jgi:Ca2+-binding EF-hand superfamily protein